MTMMDHEPWQGHVVVFGFRGVARRIVKQLARTGHHIVVIEPDATAAEIDRMRRYGAQYVEGFGQSQTVLRTVNVAGALAAVCVTDDDLRNIDIAMLVREMSTDVRIVVQMANAAVGRALQPAVEPGAVLEVAKLASRAFVEAAINRTTHEIEFGGERFVIASFPSPAAGTLRSIWGELAPIAVRPSDGSATVSCPSRDSQVAAGDIVTLVGTDAGYRSAGLVPEVQRAAPIGRTLRRRTREALAATADAVDRPFRIAFAVLAVLAAVSVAILTVGYHDSQGRDMSVLDAVYFTSETIATVGFGDYYFRDQPTWLRIWAILLILLGATLVALATALLTNALVSRRLAQSLGRQRLTGMEDHIVVIGLGAVGSKVAMDLHEAGYEVAIIDGGEGQRFVPQMRAAGMPVLIGDATLPETHADAGVRRAVGIVITTSDDLINIETGLAVRDAVGDRPIPIVLRLFGRDLARTVGARMNAGIPRSIAELAAPWFVGAVLGLDVIGTFYVGATPFMAARITVGAGDGLDGVAIQAVGAPTRVVAIRREAGAFEHPVPRDATFHAGDEAHIIGQYEDLVDLLQQPST
jgi:Trk K+ transport system NAD-binding subunit/multidrug transporter EmrE-like cation transporter